MIADLIHLSNLFSSLTDGPSYVEAVTAAGGQRLNLRVADILRDYGSTVEDVGY